MSSLQLNYGSYSFIGPIPRISLNTTIETTPAGKPIGSTVNIGIKGTIYSTGHLLYYTGGAPSIQNNAAFTGMIHIATGLIEAFSKDYELIELKCNNVSILPDNINKSGTRVNNLSFSPNGNDPNMLRSIDYSLDLSVDATGMTYISSSETFYVSSIQNSYSIESLDSLNYYGYTSRTSTPMYAPLSGEYLPMYKITRTLGATGKATKDTIPTINAKKCVDELITKDVKFDSVLNNLTIFERNSNIDLNLIDGTYTITDTCTAISGSPAQCYTETFVINHSMDIDLKRSISINGTIQGLGESADKDFDFLKDKYSTSGLKPTHRPPSKTKYSCAETGFDQIKGQLYQRALSTVFPKTTGVGGAINFYTATSNFPSYSGLINPIPFSISVEHDENNGSITYNYTYDTRPASLISGAINENLALEDTYGVRSYAMLPTIGRRPLPQDLGTYSSFNRTVSYDATFFVEGNSLSTTIEQQISGILDQFDPKKLQSTFYADVTKEDSNLDLVSGKYSKSKSWIYQKRSHIPQ